MTALKVKFRELYYITHLSNLPSILDHGILSHVLVNVKKIPHRRVYNEQVIVRSEKRVIREGKTLLEYANLYFQPRNPMLYEVFHGRKENVVVLGIDPSILYENKNIVISSGNAASNESELYFRNDFEENEWKNLITKIRKQVDLEYWSEYDGTKRKIMAELLVPDRVDPYYIREIYVPDIKTAEAVKSLIGNKLPLIPQPEIFFLPTEEIPISENLSLAIGDMFFSRCQTLTISVNTVGVMGKGLASRAKYQFPDVYVKYQDVCREKKLQIGRPYLYKRESFLEKELCLCNDCEYNLKTWFLLFPTKRHWREKSDISYIEEGLKWIVENYKKEGIQSLALPALGCGLGGLDWAQVGPLMCKYLHKLDIKVVIYLPTEKMLPREQLQPNFVLAGGIL